MLGFGLIKTARGADTSLLLATPTADRTGRGLALVRAIPIGHGGGGSVAQRI
jgi:hypothetical protein